MISKQLMMVAVGVSLLAANLKAKENILLTSQQKNLRVVSEDNSDTLTEELKGYYNLETGEYKEFPQDQVPEGWGSLGELLNNILDSLQLPTEIKEPTTLYFPTELKQVQILWFPNNEEIISKDGKVSLPEDDTTVRVDVTVKRGTMMAGKSFYIKVYAKGELDVISFVTRFYEKVLERDADKEGLDYWVTKLKNKELSGADIAYAFINSDEFKNKNLTNTDFLEILYNTFFGRASDAMGMNFWLNSLESNEKNREQILKDFIYSDEFKKICESYSIAQIDKVNDFVRRFYEKAMERSADLSGMLYWSKELKEQRKSATEIAYSFIESDEFKNKNLSDEEYIKVLYKTFFDRESEEDAEGFNYWLGELKNGKSRKDILDSFINSKEFNLICEEFGIKVSSGSDNSSEFELTQEVKNALAYMGNEERLAYDVYKTLYEYHQTQGEAIKQLLNIADKSETKHIAKVRELVNKYKITSSELSVLDKDSVGENSSDIDSIRGKYGISTIQELYDYLVAMGKNSKEDALKVGCMVEVTDIMDLNEYIEKVVEIDAQDIVEAFTSLRAGSYNHYWAFDQGLKNMGIENGCCSLGEIDGVNYCQDFPKNDNSQGNNKQKGKN